MKSASSRTSPVIRRANPSDATAIRALVLAAYQHYPNRIGMRPAPMDADHRHEIATKEVWIALQADRVRGVIVLRPEPSHLVIDNVAVHPDAQGAGLGRRLLEHAERRAADHDLAELRLLTHELMTENRALYTHLGWKPIEPPRDEHLPRVHMSKRIDSDAR